MNGAERTMSMKTAVDRLAFVFSIAARSLRRSLKRHWPSDDSDLNQIAEANITHHLFRALLQKGFHAYPEHPALGADWSFRDQKQRIDLLAFHDDLQPSPWIAIEAKRFWEAGVRADVERLKRLLPDLPDQDKGALALACVTYFSWTRDDDRLTSRQAELGLTDLVVGSHLVYGGDQPLYLAYAIFSVQRE